MTAYQKRLEELETQEKSLNAKIATEKENIVVVSKDDAVAALMAFRDGNYDDPQFQMRLFDTFIKAVYVFDDKLLIVFFFWKRRQKRRCHNSI